MKKLKIGDNVKVILGKDKGKVGTIKTIYHKKNTLVIEGINTKIKHVKPNRKEEAGKIITFDAPIDCSNVMICDESGKTTRVGFTMQENKKLRISTKTKNLISYCHMAQKIKAVYENEVVPYLKETFEYKNIHEIPKIEKIQINRGLGVAAQNNKVLQKSIDEIRQITGQQPVITTATKSIAGFKVREEMPLGITTTLRREKMYTFLDRFINLTLPRIRDFQGLDPNKFDKYGNYNLGITDQLIFPEIDYEQVDQMLGLNITIVTTAKNSKEGLALLNKIGIPFSK